MKVRLFGDSWRWVWGHQMLKSKRMRNILDPESNYTAFPFYEIYFKYAGFDCKSYGWSGRTFSETIDLVLEQTDHHDVKYNIVFFSSHIRRNPEVWEKYFDFSNYKKFINQYNDRTLNLLRQLKSWAENNDQHVILIGGQSTLYKEVFNELENNKNLHLLTECAISNFTGRKTTPHGIFKLATDITDFVSEQWDPDLVHHFYEDIESFRLDKNALHVTWPDPGHLNSTGVLFLVDLILEKIEQIENARI